MLLWLMCWSFFFTFALNDTKLDIAIDLQQTVVSAGVLNGVFLRVLSTTASSDWSIRIITIMQLTDLARPATHPLLRQLLLNAPDPSR